MALQAFLLPAAIGAGLSLLSGRDPIQGAVVGGLTGGLLGGGFEGFGSALASGGASAATSSTAPVLGGLTLEGAKQATLNEAANQAVSGTIGAGMSDYVGKHIPEHLVSNQVANTAVDSTVSPLLINSKGVPVDTPAPVTDAIDPYTKSMLMNTAAQSLLQPNTSGIQAPPVEIRRSEAPEAGKIVNVLSPGDYGVDSVTDQINVGGTGYSVFPNRIQGFGGRGMFQL